MDGMGNGLWSAKRNYHFFWMVVDFQGKTDGSMLLKVRGWVHLEPIWESVAAKTGFWNRSVWYPPINSAFFTPVNHLFSAIYRVRGPPWDFYPPAFWGQVWHKAMSDRLVRCHLSGLPYHVTRAELNGWLQETSTFFGVVQKITRRRDTGYDAWSNNKCTAFIWVKENNRPKSNQDELLLANGTIKGKYSIAIDSGVSCGHFDHATDSPEQEHLDALEVNVTPVAIPPPSTAKSIEKKPSKPIKHFTQRRFMEVIGPNVNTHTHTLP